MRNIVDFFKDFLGSPKKPFVYGKSQDGTMWVFAAYSTNFRDNEGDILTEQSHIKYAKLVNETGLKPILTYLHQPQVGIELMHKIFSKSEGNVELINNSLGFLYKKYALGVVEKIGYAYGHAFLIARIFPEREGVVKKIYDSGDHGLSHRFFAATEEDDTRNVKSYLSFEMCFLRRSVAANKGAGPITIRRKTNMKPLPRELKEDLKEVFDMSDEEIQNIASDAEKRERILGLVYDRKMNDAPEEGEEEVSESGTQVEDNAMSVESFAKALQPVLEQSFAEMSEQIKALSQRVAELEASRQVDEDAVVARQYEIDNWKLGFIASEEEVNVLPEQVQESLDRAKKSQASPNLLDNLLGTVGG